MAHSTDKCRPLQENYNNLFFSISISISSMALLHIAFVSSPKIRYI